MNTGLISQLVEEQLVVHTTDSCAAERSTTCKVVSYAMHLTVSIHRHCALRSAQDGRAFQTYSAVKHTRCHRHVSSCIKMCTYLSSRRHIVGSLIHSEEVELGVVSLVHKQRAIHFLHYNVP